jgi:hypothetical protein
MPNERDGWAYCLRMRQPYQEGLLKAAMPRPKSSISLVCSCTPLSGLFFLRIFG